MNILLKQKKKRNIDVVPFLMTMDNIIMSDKIQYPLLGIATKDRKNVFIGEYCADINEINISKLN